MFASPLNMQWNVDIFVSLKNFDCFIAIFIKFSWHMKFVSLLGQQILVTSIVANTFVIVKDFFVIAIDVVPFVVTHFFVSQCLWLCYCLWIFYNLVPFLQCKNQIPLWIHNTLLIDVLFVFTIDEHNNLLCIPTGVVVSWSKCPSTPFTCSPWIFVTVKLPMFKEFSIDVFKDYGSCKPKDSPNLKFWN